MARSTRSPGESSCPTLEGRRRVGFVVRSETGLKPGKVSDKDLADLLGLEVSVLEVSAVASVPFSAAFRDGKREGVVIQPGHPTSRRFTATRLMGDSLAAHDEDRLLPATSSFSARQKFQRAFAQEFLCPTDELLGELGDKYPDEDWIESIADHLRRCRLHSNCLYACHCNQKPPTHPRVRREDGTNAHPDVHSHPLESDGSEALLG